MRAIRIHEFGGPDVMRLEELPDPVPGPGQVVVRIEAAGVNPVETYVRSGVYAAKPPLPFTPGTDGAGIVAAVGAEVTTAAVGDRVYLAGSLSGTYAELTLAAAEQVHPLPSGTSPTEGAALFVPYATAYRALFQIARVQPGETVLIHGASGGVGCAALQLARAAGVRVIGTAGSPSGLELVAVQGADHALDHSQAGYLDRVPELTDQRGADVILEMLANVNLGRDLTALAKGGRVVVVGSRGTVEINPRDLMARDASVTGMLLWNTPPAAMRAIHAALQAGLRNGVLRPVIGRQFPLSEAPRAHEAVLTPGAHGKIVLIPGA